MPLDEALIGDQGIMLDREYMVVDERGMFVSQRNGKTGDDLTYGVRSMCLIAPSIRGNNLTVSAPDMPGLEFPLYQATGEKLKVRVWKSVCEAQEISPMVSAWFTEYMSRERPGRYRLVRMSDNFTRASSAGFALTAFSDGFPFLVVSQESLDELNRRITGAPVAINRFRPNIVISGCSTPHAEDTMDRIEINGVIFQGHWICDRCPMPGVEQETAKKDGRPLLALAKYRRMKEGSDKVQFGRNFNHLCPGRIRVGDEVEVVYWSA
jgi:hypothetical protein